VMGLRERRQRSVATSQRDGFEPWHLVLSDIC
jgi:hypothetical protein